MSDVQAPTEYPIDTSELVKGSVVTDAEVRASAPHLTPGTKDYRLYKMRLRGLIEARVSERYGLPVTVAEVRGDIRVLTDSEASSYNEAKHEGGVRTIRRALVRQIGVDSHNLTDYERREHERRVLAQSRDYQALKNARKKIKASPDVRELPSRS